MGWAKVDDGWWSHPKVMGLSLPARGLWVSALSWSCHQRRDVVPPRFLAMVGADVEVADELVEAGLWLTDEGGWVIHDWAEYQEMSLSEKRAEAGAKGGKRSGQVRRAKAGEANTEAPAKQTNQTVEANAEAGPSHPIPTQPEHPPSSADADGEPDPFDEFWQACPRKVGKTDARRRWHRATRDVDPQVLIDAMAAHAERWAADGTDHRFIPHPATWLNQGRWADELVTQDTGPPEFRPNPQMARNARRAAGQACPDCADTGWVDLPDGSVGACGCQAREATG